MKKVFAMLLALSMIFLCGCNNKYEETAEKFILCVAEESFEEAVSLMHPECKVNADEISSYFALLENEANIKLKDNFQLESLEIESFEDTEATVLGEHTKASGIALADGIEFTFTLKLVENDNGYGIYKIKFNVK